MLKLVVWRLLQQMKQWGRARCCCPPGGEVQVQAGRLVLAQVRHLSLQPLSPVLMQLLLPRTLRAQMLLLLLLLQRQVQLQVRASTRGVVWPQLWRGWVTACPTCQTAHSSRCPQLHPHSSASARYVCPRSCAALPSSTRSLPAPTTHHVLPTRRCHEKDCSHPAAS